MNTSLTAVRGVLLMRHSAREFNRDINDLLNPLTDHGRQLAVAMGGALTADIQLRGYASPPERCVETAELLLQGAAAQLQQHHRCELQLWRVLCPRSYAYVEGHE